MFGWKRKDPQADWPEYTNRSYSRWLRAGKPHFAMFHRLSEDEQETLASIGDEHTGQCIGVLIAELIEALAGPQAPEDERDRAVRMTEQALRDMDSKVPKPVTMSGISKRRDDREKQARKKTRDAQSLMGRKPDEEAEAG